MRQFTPSEADSASRLLEFVGEHAYLQPTGTGLEKSIMDATGPLRLYLAAVNAHDYSVQGKGQLQKRITEGRLVVAGNVLATQVSLYRPETKNGDPRMWVSSLREWAKPNDILAVFYHDSMIHVLNLSTCDLGRLAEAEIQASSRVDLELLSEIRRSRLAPAQELIGLLTNVAGGWLRSVGHGSTAVGRTIEDALSIRMNSSKLPDFKGIEIKTARYVGGASASRMSLFGQAPCWPESPCGGSEALLERYGYHRNGLARINCTIKHTRANGQGLQLVVDHTTDKLLVVAPQVTDGVRKSMSKRGEISLIPRNPAAVGVGRELACLWYLSTLRDRLVEKHAETFWVQVQPRQTEDGREEFRVIAATHTEKPYALRLGTLIERDILDVDFLIKRTEAGAIRDRSYPFKLKRGYLSELFPPPRHYQFADP